MKLRFAILIALLGLSGCAASTYCEGQQDYQRARSVPVLQPADGLRLPESEHALRIPPPPANAVPYGEVVRDEEGDEVVRCLDKPPVLAPLPPEPAEAPPAEPAKPAETLQPE
ncbi:MAG: hypothetical protein ACRES8_03670 [Nevskiaceae bacterium]